MKLQLVPPRRGMVWVRKAFQIFARQPLGFAALFAACLFVFLLLGLIPFVGTILLLILPPAGSLLFMIATRLATEGKAPIPAAIVELARAGRPRLVALLKLGIAYAAATFFVFWLAGVLDGGALEAFLDSLPDAKTAPEAAAARVADPRAAVRPGAAPALRRRRCRCRSGMRRRWSTGAARAGPSRSSSAASRSGATRARSRSTASAGSRSG